MSVRFMLERLRRYVPMTAPTAVVVQLTPAEADALIRHLYERPRETVLNDALRKLIEAR